MAHNPGGMDCFASGHCEERSDAAIAMTAFFHIKAQQKHISDCVQKVLGSRLKARQAADAH